MEPNTKNKKVVPYEITRYLYSQEFTDLCKKISKKIKHIFEESRLRDRKMADICAIYSASGMLIITILVILLYFIPISAIALTLFFFIGCFVLGGYFGIMILSKKSVNPRKEAKKNFLPMLFEPLGNVEVISKNDPKYDLSSYIKDLILFDKYDGYYCDDRFTCNFKNTKVDIAEIVMTKGEGETKITVFEGIYVKIPYKQQEDKWVLIKKNNLLKNIAENKVILEDVEFEKYYDAFSDDQIYARSILTPALMQRLVKLKMQKKEVILSFENDNINIAISDEHNLFEFSEYEFVSFCDSCRKIIYDFYMILGIIQELKLDEKLGKDL